MKAMILAAGKGTRLGKLTENIPKALIDINGKSVLHHAVEKCTSSGFGDIIVNVHHFADMVEKEITKLNDIGYHVTVSDEREQLLETGGGLFKAGNFFDNAPFLLYNADIITDLDLTQMYRFHIRTKGLATLAVRNRKGSRFFLVDRKGMLHGWCNKATGEQIISTGSNEKLSEAAFSGIHIINPEIFNYMNEGVYTMTSLYLRLASGHKIITWLQNEGFWYDVGTPEMVEEVRRRLEK